MVNTDQSLKLATKFFLAVMILGILGFALVIVLGNLFSTANNALPALSGGTTVNETTTLINSTGAFLSVSDVNAVSCDILVITNESSGLIIDQNNFTITNCLIANSSSTDAGITGRVINVSFDHTLKDDAAVNLLSNLTAGAESFFSNASSWFTLLSVIIIIAIVTVVIAVVRGTRGRKEDL